MIALTCAAAVVVCISTNTVAETYPEKPVRMIVPSSPGGGLDRLARMLGQGLSESLGQQFIVDNRAGAGQTIGTALVAKAAPDGHTLLVASNNIAISPSLYKHLPYDPLTDLTPVTIVASVPSALVTHASLPIHSLQDLLALAKKKPGELNYVSGGKGAISHLGVEMLKQMTGIDIVHIPYKGVGPAVNEMVAGRAALLLVGYPPILGHLKAGRLRVLASVEAKRTALMPDVPTVAEQGFPEYAVENWLAILAPSGTSAQIVRRLNGALARMLGDAQLRSRLTAESYEVVANTPEQFAAVLRADMAKWAKVVQKAGIQLD